MQSFCIEERGTYKNNSGTGLKRRVELKLKQLPNFLLFLCCLSTVVCADEFSVCLCDGGDITSVQSG